MDLSYLNARIRGWRKGLFKSGDYELFMEAESMEAYLELLRPSVYGPDIGVASARFERPYDVLSSALRSNLTRSFTTLWDIAPPGARVYLKALFSTWEVYDIKAVLRGIDKGIRREDIFEALVPAGEMDVSALRELARSRDVTDLLGLLRTWSSPYAAPLKDGLEAYRKHHSLVEMEINLDVFITKFFASTISAGPENGHVITGMLTDRVDSRNIMTLMKAVGEGYSKETLNEYFLEGGRRIGKGEFLRLSGLTTREELLTQLLEAVKDENWRRVLYIAGAEEMDMLEEFFENLVARALTRAAIEGPLTIALAAAFIYAKVREVKNMRIIARGKLFSIPSDELKRLLIYKH
jgi:V/A-type H+-transporting ATPase subunit C